MYSWLHYIRYSKSESNPLLLTSSYFYIISNLKFANSINSNIVSDLSWWRFKPLILMSEMLMIDHLRSLRNFS
jgi:hypothetical protein